MSINITAVIIVSIKTQCVLFFNLLKFELGYVCLKMFHYNIHKDIDIPVSSF